MQPTRSPRPVAATPSAATLPPPLASSGGEPTSHQHVLPPRVIPRHLHGASALPEAWLRAASLRPGCPLVVVSSADGGVGRSTLTAALGAVLALACPNPPLAVEATGRAWGGLIHRVPRRSEASIWDAYTAVHAEAPLSTSTVDAWMHLGTTGLHTLIAEVHRTGTRRPPVFLEAMRVVGALRTRYPLAVLDVPVADVRGVWELLADAACPLLVARASTDGVQHTMRLLAQLCAGGLAAVADRAVVAVSAAAPSPPREVRAAVRQLAGQAGAVVTVPFDAHLARPEPTDPARLRKPTRLALVELAAAVLARCPADPDLAAVLADGADHPHDTAPRPDGRAN
ncbi:hypothetical protein AB0M46_13740 [Dactylosporangium sp. NPDC051485]|uniref:hypothetical protein n=1 Tax=Dactylosporangium sp. NPDC051485 TaxID=3154846 RepID=UPI003445B108